MNTFNFYSQNSNDFIPLDYDLEIFDEITLPSPPTTIDDDWLDIIPTHSESPTLVSDHPLEEGTVMGDTTPTTLKSPPTHPEESPEKEVHEEEEIKPAFNFLPLNEVINFHNTRLFHQSFTWSSMEHHGVPRSIEERWENHDLDEGKDIFALISYYAFFYGHDSLTEWQKRFLKDYVNPHLDTCYFCELPKGYWCDRVAKKL